MIRNVVVGRLRDDAGLMEREQLGRCLAGIKALSLPGQLDVRIGLDAGLRDGSWSSAITNDWVDEAAYRCYDNDPEHNQYRAMIVAVCAEVARVQFEID